MLIDTIDTSTYLDWVTAAMMEGSNITERGALQDYIYGPWNAPEVKTEETWGAGSEAEDTMREMMAIGQAERRST